MFTCKQAAKRFSLSQQHLNGSVMERATNRVPIVTPHYKTLSAGISEMAKWGTVYQD